MSQAFIVDAIRTPFGRYGGAFSSVRTDDLGAIPLRALMARNPNVDWAAVTDVLYGCLLFDPLHNGLPDHPVPDA
jgi:acetyl-CoA acetyltransferase